MATGIALVIGLNSVNPTNYDGWAGTLDVCENDAESMAQIATSKGFKVEKLLTQDATRDNVISKILQNANVLQKGDIFLMTYSGHGNHVPNLNKGPGDEEDEDQTWCLYDNQFIDDEISNLFSKFSEGVRILVISDSCYSGDITKDPEIEYKLMPADHADKAYEKNKEFYESILHSPELQTPLAEVNASVLLLASSQVDQTSQVRQNANNSLFTAKLLEVWEAGAFKGRYHEFLEAVTSLMPATQTPNYEITGKPNPDFENQDPFYIG